MSSPTITQLGRYRILSEIGRGAMGVVYRALDPALDRTVAIKTILLSSDPQERASYEARFTQEAKAAGKLAHPAIITIYDVGREGDLAYMAMEMLEGIDLRDRMARGRLPLRDALSLAAQVAEGLAFAHEHGVVHRDIKPANIMIVRGARAKIMDFGIARLQLSDVKTQTGVLLGTPKYMSPEQIAGRPLDHRSDIFSLGAMLYEMVVGRTPFSGSDTAQLMNNIAHAPHAAPSRIVSDAPPLLDLIVARALEKEPESRYQGAQDLAADLNACVAEITQSLLAAEDTLADLAIQHPHPGRHPEDPSDTTQRLSSAGTEVLQRPSERTVAATRTIIAASFWPVSRRYPSGAAVLRLARPTAIDRARLELPPRPPGSVARFLRDGDLRVLLLALCAATIVALAVALG